VAVFWLPQAEEAVVTRVGRPRAAVAGAVALAEPSRAAVAGAAPAAPVLAALRGRRAAAVGRLLLARAGRAVGSRAPAGLVAAELVDPAALRPAGSES